MPYLTPKTDWTVNISGGVYLGDFLNSADYTRICENITYLAQLLYTIYGITVTLDSMPSRAVGSIPYASDFNAIETNIQRMCNAWFTPSTLTGQKTWYNNKPSPKTDDWNRWESTIASIKARIDYDAQWVAFYTVNNEPFVDADGNNFKILDA